MKRGSNLVAIRSLRRSSALITNGHFVYTSGKHGSTYVNKDAIYPHTKEISKLCKLIAKYFAKNSVDIVLAPAVGGIVLSQWTAHHLNKITEKEVLAIYADKKNDGSGFVIKRGYDKLLEGKNVLVVEDIINTGGSARSTIEAARAVGGHVVGLAAICNRMGVTASALGNVPILYSLVNMDLGLWLEKDCPLCKAGVPINTEVGKGGRSS